AIMFVFMMVVFLMWSRNELADTRAQGWLEAVRKSNFNELVASHAAAPEEPSRGGEASGAHVPQAAAKTASTSGGIDDDEHLAAYNAYLARLNQPGRGPDGHR